MKRSCNARAVCAACWVILLLLPALPGNASSVRQVSVTQMLQQSDLVFEGTAIKFESKENSRKRIHTYITFAINEIIKGSYAGDTIVLRFLGGTVGDVTMEVSDMVLPDKGEHGIYFVESLKRVQSNPLYGWSQGHFLVERDKSGSFRVFTNKHLPVTGVMDDTPEQPSLQAQNTPLVFSKGVAEGITASGEEKAAEPMTSAEFKQILLERVKRDF